MAETLHRALRLLSLLQCRPSGMLGEALRRLGSQLRRFGGAAP
ncbi:MAG: hypothetical protein ACOYBY_16035 [Dermatophilaceae bacterium]